VDGCSRDIQVGKGKGGSCSIVEMSASDFFLMTGLITNHRKIIHSIVFIN
jgi:hypothetical protein